jgi:hypothetical protein
MQTSGDINMYGLILRHAPRGSKDLFERGLSKKYATRNKSKNAVGPKPKNGFGTHGVQESKLMPFLGPPPEHGTELPPHTHSRNETGEGPGIN